MRVYGKNKKIKFQAYLYPEDYDRLLMLKTSIRREHNQIVPLTELVRDSILSFLAELETEKDVEKYLICKGLVD